MIAYISNNVNIFKSTNFVYRSSAYQFYKQQLWQLDFIASSATHCWQLQDTKKKYLSIDNFYHRVFYRYKNNDYKNCQLTK